MMKQEQNIKHWKTRTKYQTLENINNSTQQKLQKESERENETTYSFTNLEPKVHNFLYITKVKKCKRQELNTHKKKTFLHHFFNWGKKLNCVMFRIFVVQKVLRWNEWNCIMLGTCPSKLYNFLFVFCISGQIDSRGNRLAWETVSE